MEEEEIHSEILTDFKSRVLLQPESWLAKIDFINYLILFNKVLISILAEKNGGKTSFATLLVNNLDSQIKVVSLNAEEFSDEEVIKELVVQLQLEQGADLDVFSLVKHINEQNNPVLIVIDNAQLLSDSFIRDSLLAIKEQGNLGFFHLCLISDYSLVSLLNNSVSSTDNVIHTIELGSLTERETRSYVLQQGIVQGLLDKPLLESQIQQLYQLTKGNIAKINRILKDFILNNSEEKKKIPLQLIKKISTSVSIILIVALSFYLIINTSLFKKQEHELLTQFVEKPQILESHIAFWLDSAKRQAIDSVLLKKQLPKFSEPKALIDKVVVIPKIKKRKLNSETYTIQIIASHNKKDLEYFKNNNKLLAPHLQLRHVTNARGVWYVVTMGKYKSKAQARQHIRQLPQRLAKFHPWVRGESSLS